MNNDKRKWFCLEVDPIADVVKIHPLKYIGDNKDDEASDELNEFQNNFWNNCFLISEIGIKMLEREVKCAIGKDVKKRK